MEFGTDNILITGANGWLGKNLVHSLFNGIKKSPGIDKPNKNLKIKCFVFKGENTSFLDMQSKNISILIISIFLYISFRIIKNCVDKNDEFLKISLCGLASLLIFQTSILYNT